MTSGNYRLINYTLGQGQGMASLIKQKTLIFLFNMTKFTRVFRGFLNSDKEVLKQDSHERDFFLNEYCDHC